MPDATTYSKLEIPSDDPHNVQATKYYIFNETGNIMMVSTDDTSQDIEQSVRDVFAEVSVFFAAMTRAISTTVNPATKEPYSIYNYHALEKIIGGSGLFVHVTQTDVSHQSQSIGAQFSRELLQGLLGLATGAGALSFAQAMISSIGQEGLRMSGSKTSDESKVGNIVFVCEYLLGMPTVSAIVVYADVTANSVAWSVGPCISGKSSSETWLMHKDTYLFVTPRFVRDYSDDLASIASNTSYNDFVEYLRAILENRPAVSEVMTRDNKKAPVNLVPGDEYVIMGVNLSGTVTVQLGNTDVIEAGATSYSSVPFTVKANAPETPPSPIKLLDGSGALITKAGSHGVAKKAVAEGKAGATAKTGAAAKA